VVETRSLDRSITFEIDSGQAGAGREPPFRELNEALIDKWDKKK
jgi:hypothetical protein